MKLPVGSRVIIKSKHGSIEELKFSAVHKRMLAMNQPYAYIKRIDLALDCYVIIERSDRCTDEMGGDFYDENDVELDYKYYRKEKIKKLNESNKKPNIN